MSENGRVIAVAERVRTRPAATVPVPVSILWVLIVVVVAGVAGLFGVLADLTFSAIPDIRAVAADARERNAHREKIKAIEDEELREQGEIIVRLEQEKQLIKDMREGKP